MREERGLEKGSRLEGVGLCCARIPSSYCAFALKPYERTRARNPTRLAPLLLLLSGSPLVSPHLHLAFSRSKSRSPLVAAPMSTLEEAKARKSAPSAPPAPLTAPSGQTPASYNETLGGKGASSFRDPCEIARQVRRCVRRLKLPRRRCSAPMRGRVGCVEVAGQTA